MSFFGRHAPKFETKFLVKIQGISPTDFKIILGNRYPYPLADCSRKYKSFLVIRMFPDQIDAARSKDNKWFGFKMMAKRLN